MGLSQSKAEHAAEFTVEATVLADVAQDVVRQLGLEVKKVSRETGMISARAPSFSFHGNREIILTISKIGNGASRISAVATAAEGLMTSGRAQHLITQFFGALAAHEAMTGKSAAGW